MKTFSYSVIRRLGIIGAVLALGVALVACAQPEPEVAEAPANPLTGITWQWVSLTQQPGGMATEVVQPANYTLVLNQDGTLSGRADCNNFSGTYSQTNGFTISLGATTAAACGEGSLDQQYLGLLAAVVAGGPDGQGGLALENAGGENRMLFSNGGAASN